MKAGLSAWDGVGTILASAAVGCVGYVGFTVAQVVSVATADETGVTAVADPPALAAPSAGPASPDAPPDAPSAEQPSERSAVATSDGPEPSRRADRHPPPAPSAASEARSRQQSEVRHARWADRQLAAMLRATPHTTLWFGGAAWMTPVVDYHLTARFGQSGSLWASTHTGLDFAAPTGTPVRAATAGTVTSVGWAGAYGNKIEITHPDGSETWYAHLSRTDVRVGSQVGTGALIGAVGATGNVTGPHLHFEVRLGGDSPVDPELALRQHGVHA